LGSVTTYLECVGEHPFLFRFRHRDPPADPEIAAVCQEIADRGTEGIAELIRFGAADAKSVKGITVDEAAWILARATQSACGGVATWWYENRDVPRERVVELVFMLLWQGLYGIVKQASACWFCSASCQGRGTPARAAPHVGVEAITAVDNNFGAHRAGQLVRIEFNERAPFGEHQHGVGAV